MTPKALALLAWASVGVIFGDIGEITCVQRDVQGYRVWGCRASFDARKVGRDASASRSLTCGIRFHSCKHPSELDFVYVCMVLWGVIRSRAQM